MHLQPNICTSLCTNLLMTDEGKTSFNFCAFFGMFISQKSTVTPSCTALVVTGSEDHASTMTKQSTIRPWRCHKSVLLVWLLLEHTEMLCFSLSVLTTVATGDWSTFLESLILPSVGSRPKYLTCQKKFRANDLTTLTRGFSFDFERLTPTWICCPTSKPKAVGCFI